MKRRDFLLSSLTTGIGSGATQAFADMPIRIVVPYVAGGLTDTIARLLAVSMGYTLKRDVIVDNRPGASGLIATKFVQESPPDGNALLFHNSGIIVLPMLQKSARYDPVADFVPVANVASSPSFLIVNSGVPAKTLSEFIVYGKASRDGVTAANSGMRSAGFVATALFAHITGMTIKQIPYKGSAETANAVVSGEVKMELTALTPALVGQMHEGKVRVLAVNGYKRSSLLPDAPTLGESIPGVWADDSWFGLFASKGTPSDKIEQIAAAIKIAMADPTIKQRLEAAVVEPSYSSSDEFRDLVSRSANNWIKILKVLNITAQ
jgi:tripartite-type tricarboxylate transporter receptor subunit TctC